MSRLPVISGKKCVQALSKIGFIVIFQQGSPIILVREAPKTSLS
jgi:predicted RNA binding protein YcfA (HicA-like mRNA interferase family)